MAECEPVELETIFVSKRRFSRIGLRLEGSHHPKIVSSTHEKFFAGDIVFYINGRPAVGSRNTSWFILTSKHLSVTVWRRSILNTW
jgi:hypothetical protein